MRLDEKWKDEYRQHIKKRWNDMRTDEMQLDEMRQHELHYMTDEKT